MQECNLQLPAKYLPGSQRKPAPFPPEGPRPSSPSPGQSPSHQATTTPPPPHSCASTPFPGSRSSKAPRSSRAASRPSPRIPILRPNRHLCASIIPPRPSASPGRLRPGEESSAVSSEGKAREKTPGNLPPRSDPRCRRRRRLRRHHHRRRLLLRHRRLPLQILPFSGCCLSINGYKYKTTSLSLQKKREKRRAGPGRGGPGERCGDPHTLLFLMHHRYFF